MKNLQQTQTEIFNKYGVFFAFSNKQFDEHKKEGVAYKSLGAGMIAPAKNASVVIKELTAAIDEHIKNDLEENGKKKIIHRELANHEAEIAYDIEDTFYALEDYGISREEIQKEFVEYLRYCN